MSYVYLDGITVTVTVEVENVTNLHGVNFNLLFDDDKLDLVSVKEGSFLPSGGETTFFSDTSPGVVNVSTALLGAGLGVSGSDSIAIVTFIVPETALLPADLTLEEVILVDHELNPISADIQMGRIEKRGMPFDCNRDCYINYDDLVCLAMSWHCRVGEDCFNPAMDCPADDYVDYRDLFNFSMVWHTSCDDPWDTLISCEPVSPAPMRWPEAELASTSKIDATVSVTGEKTLEVKIMANQVADMHGVNIDLSFDSRKLEVTEVEKGDLISGMSFFKVDTRQAGLINLAGTFLGRDPGVDGSGVLARVVFKVNKTPEVYQTPGVSLSQVIVADHNNIQYNLTPGALESVITLKDLIPTRNSLHQNYPNPLNPETWIPFSLSTRANVVINIYSLSGQLIRTLELGEKEAGYYPAKGGIKSAAYWDGKDETGKEVTSGVYLYQLRAGSFVSTRKMIVVK
ncbi:MAG: cohesin domain-containing protein [bacterium]